MAQRPRKNKKRISTVPAVITEEYRNDLIFKDFLGELSPDEIVLAKKLGIYKWDSYIKKRNARMKGLSTIAD